MRILLILLLMTSNVLAYEKDWSAEATAKLVAYLDESSSTAADATSNGNTGTVTGSTRPKPAAFGTGYQFNTTDKINFGSAASLDNLPSGSGIYWSFWLKFNSFSATINQRVFDKSSVDIFILATGGGAPYHVDFTNLFSGGNGVWSWDAPLTDTNWHHYCGYYVGTNTTNVPVLYFDGQLQTLTSSTQPVGTYTSDAASDFIVGNLTGGTRPTDGIIDDVVIGSGTITAAQCNGLMNNGADGKGSHARQFIGD